MGIHAIFGLFLAVSLLTGCGRQQPVASARTDGILLLGNGPEPQSLDPHVTSGTAELNIQMAVFEGLVSPDPQTLEPVPAVAESWAVSEDGRTYLFKLRSDARWSDGRPVRAVDFVQAWKRALSPERGTPYASMLYVLKGAKAYNQEGITDELDGAIKALADDELELSLEEPVPYFLSLLMHPVWYPIPAHLASGDSPELAGVWTLPDSFVGNGPFVLSEWLPNQYLEAVVNPMYWDVETVRLEAVRFYAMDEPGAEERAFLSGQLHMTDALPPARVAAYQGENSPSLRIDPYLGTYYILPNVREGVLGDVRVRRALSLTIDRKAIVEHLLGAGQRAAAGFVPDNMPGYNNSIPVVYDPDQARALLAEAGYPDGEGFPELEYLFNSSESHRKIAEALQGMWREELGISVRLANQEWRTYVQRRESGDFQLARAVWIGDYPEPSSFLDLWRSDSVNNWAGWTDPDYDVAMQAAHLEGDPEKRMVLYQDAEQLLIAEQAILPLYFYVTVYLKDPAVQGWYPNLLDWHPLKAVYFAE